MTLTTEFRHADQPPDHGRRVVALVEGFGRHAYLSAMFNRNGWLVTGGYTVLAWAEEDAVSAEAAYRQLFPATAEAAP